jgi:tyrosyl-tRNA synthetase
VTLTPATGAAGLALPKVLKESGLTSSTSEAIRLIKQGGVRIDGEKASDPGLEIAAGQTHVFQVGRRKFMRIRVRN